MAAPWLFSMVSFWRLREAHSCCPALVVNASQILTALGRITWTHPSARPLPSSVAGLPCALQIFSKATSSSVGNWCQGWQAKMDSICDGLMVLGCIHNILHFILLWLSWSISVYHICLLQHRMNELEMINDTTQKQSCSYSPNTYQKIPNEKLKIK